MEGTSTENKKKLEVREVMFLAVGGTTLLAFIAGSSIIASGPGQSAVRLARSRQEDLLREAERRRQYAAARSETPGLLDRLTAFPRRRRSSKSDAGGEWRRSRGSAGRDQSATNTGGQPSIVRGDRGSR